MPRGTRHVETGLLRPGNGGYGYALEREDGGLWQLDGGGFPQALLGQRVRVEGVRAGFNLLHVSRIVRLAGGSGPGFGGRSSDQVRG